MYLALGSNKGERLAYLKKAYEFLSSEFNVLKVSSVYETIPYGNKNQPDFLNAVLALETEKELFEIFRITKDIEKKTGRTDSERWGEREIDIDILFFNDAVIFSESYTVPHKGIAERDFVLAPLAEISPELVHPVLKKTAGDLLKEVTEKNIIRIFPEKII